MNFTRRRFLQFGAAAPTAYALTRARQLAGRPARPQLESLRGTYLELALFGADGRELRYKGYARPRVPRSELGWVVRQCGVSLNQTVTFGECASAGAASIATEVHILNSAGHALFVAPLNAPLVISVAVTPMISAGCLTLSYDDGLGLVNEASPEVKKMRYFARNLLT